MSDVDAPTAVKKKEHSISDTAKAHSHDQECIQDCFPFCFRSDLSGFDDELVEILNERKQKKSISDPSDPETIYKTFQYKKDGCSETGYFSKPKRSLHHKSLEKLRKSCAATKHLSSPEIAIKMSNLRQQQGLSTGNRLMKNAERNVSEINQMLLHRLSGTVVLNDESPNESGEALLSYQAINSQIQPLIISHLVHDADKKRISFSTESNRKRRRSSFSVKNLDVNFQQNNQGASSSKQQDPMNETSDADFINNLPKISRMVKSELESNLYRTQKYIKKLRIVLQSSNVANLGGQRNKLENWLVILFTSSEETSGLTEFNCNLVRLILQHHCVAYEERDIAVKKQQFKKQLQTIINSDAVKVPFVCAKGVSIGGVQVIFVMHKMRLINEIFKDFIISPDVYVDWLYKRSKSKTPLTLNVKISGFPALKQMLSHRSKTNLTRGDRKLVTMGKNILKRSKNIWNVLSKEMYTQPSLLKLVLLRNTIILAYTILNKLYYDYLPGRKTFTS